MPGVVELAITTWVVPALFESGILLGAGGITFLSYAITFAAYYAYGTYQARQARGAARDAFNASLRDRLIMTALTDNPRSRVYGRVRNVDGILFKATHGANKEFYSFVVAVAGHEIDGFEDFYFNDAKLTLDGSGYVTWPPPYSKVDRQVQPTVPTGSSATSGSFTLPLPAGTTLTAGTAVSGFTWNGAEGVEKLQLPVAVTVAGNVASWTGGDGNPVFLTYSTDRAVSKARIRGYTGALGQDLSADLIALGIDNVTVEHKFHGIACMLVTLEFDVDVFPSGVPSMSAVIRGAKVFDPRNGVVAWSENPALIARDWALYPYGGGAQASDLYDDFIPDANACDVFHDFVLQRAADGSPIATTHRRMYTCGIVCPTQGDPSQAFNEIVASMAGKSAWVGGRLRLRAGFYRAPVATITEDWISDKNSIDVQPGVARNDLVNVYRPSIANYRHDYVVEPTVAVRADAYVAADGMELPREVQFVGITDSEHAQHVAGVLLRDARQALTVKLPCNMRAYPIEVFDTVAVTLSRFGWNAKVFEVLAVEFSPATGVLLTMKETDPSIFDPDAAFTAEDASPNTELPLPWVAPQPTLTSITSGATRLDDGSVATRVEVEWDPISVASVLQSGSIEIQYTIATDIPAGGADWPSWPERASALKTVIPGLQGGTVYLFRARTINSIGVRSTWSLPKQHLVAYPPEIAIDWTNIAGAPIMFRAVAKGFDDTSLPASAAGLYDVNSGVRISGASRSYMLNVIRRSDGVVTFSSAYDVYAGGSGAADLAAKLNSIGNDSVVVVRSYDEPRNNRLTAGLPAAMYRCGASPTIFGSIDFESRSAYVLIGIGGCGVGRGFEDYSPWSPDGHNAAVDVAFMLKGGNLIVTGTSNRPGTLRDYGYVGTLDATTDVLLLARGDCVVAGNYVEKVGGIAAWDSDAYTVNSFRGGAFASARSDSLNKRVVFGLNSDPLTDSSFGSIDYGFFFSATQTVVIYESGVAIADLGAYWTDEIYTITYDGAHISYWRGPTLLRTVAAAAGLAFFFDSSFYDPGAALALVRFGPLSAVTGIDTKQLLVGSVTDVVTDNGGVGGLSVPGGSAFTDYTISSITYPNLSGVAINLSLEASIMSVSRAGGGAFANVNAANANVYVTTPAGTTIYPIGLMGDTPTDNGGWYGNVMGTGILHALGVGETATISLIVDFPTSTGVQSVSWAKRNLRLLVLKR